MATRLAVLGVPEEELNARRLEAGSPRGTVTWTPLQYACALGDADLVAELLAAHPEDINAPGNTKYTYSPLHVAVRFEHENVVKLLLATTSPHISVNAIDNQTGCTPLHLAVLQGNAAIAKLLLTDTNAQQLETKNGTTPMELAGELKLSEMTALLVDHAARSSGRAQLADWLASIGLIQYATQLFDEGFDDAQFLLATGGLKDETLDVMHIQKAGHRAKLQSLYQLQEFLADGNASEEEEDSQVSDGQEESDSEGEDSDDEEDSEDDDSDRSDDSS